MNAKKANTSNERNKSIMLCKILTNPLSIIASISGSSRSFTARNPALSPFRAVLKARSKCSRHFSAFSFSF